MKKLYSIVANIALVAVMTTSNIHAMNPTEPERPQIWRLIDGFINTPQGTEWHAIFSMLDKMQGTIFINNYRDEEGSPLLNRAVTEGNFLATKILCTKYNADPNLQDETYGNTPLISAVKGNNIGMVLFLLRHGANPSIRDYEDYSSFDHAANKNDILNLLNSYRQR